MIWKSSQKHEHAGTKTYTHAQARTDTNKDTNTETHLHMKRNTRIDIHTHTQRHADAHKSRNIHTSAIGPSGARPAPPLPKDPLKQMPERTTTHTDIHKHLHRHPHSHTYRHTRTNTHRKHETFFFTPFSNIFGGIAPSPQKATQIVRKCLQIGPRVIKNGSKFSPEEWNDWHLLGRAERGPSPPYPRTPPKHIP